MQAVVAAAADAVAATVDADANRVWGRGPLDGRGVRGGGEAGAEDAAAADAVRVAPHPAAAAVGMTGGGITAAAASAAPRGGRGADPPRRATPTGGYLSRPPPPAPRPADTSNPAGGAGAGAAATAAAAATARRRYCRCRGHRRRRVAHNKTRPPRPGRCLEGWGGSQLAVSMAGEPVTDGDRRHDSGGGSDGRRGRGRHLNSQWRSPPPSRRRRLPVRLARPPPRRCCTRGQGRHRRRATLPRVAAALIPVSRPSPFPPPSRRTRSDVISLLHTHTHAHTPRHRS